MIRLAFYLWILSPLVYAKYERVREVKLFNGETLSEYKLENGFRILHLARHQAKVLTYQTWFWVGSVHEKMDPKLKKTGLAHLFEHMMFRGTSKYPDGKFDEITARIGGDKQNATTSYYRTNYFESIPSHQLETLMELESDRMRNLKLTPELFEKEKGAVVGEYRRHMDTPAAVAYDELTATMFEKSPYRYTVLGTEEEIKGFTVEEGVYFYRTFYAPNNAVLIIAGDVTEKPLMKLVEKYYGDMKPQEIPKGEIPGEEPQKKERRTIREHSQATSDILVLGYPIPDVNSPDIIPLSLLGAHLATGMESRLRKILVDKGIAVGAGAEPSHQPNLFEFFIQLAEGHRAEQALSILDREISSLQKTAISKEMFERALNQEKLQVYDSITDNSALGNLLGEYLMLSHNYLRGFEILEGYARVTPNDLKRVTKDFLRKEKRTVVIIRPKEKKA